MPDVDTPPTDGDGIVVVPAAGEPTVAGSEVAPRAGASTPVVDADLDAEIAGLDALELGGRPRLERAQRIWRAAWPKLLAVAIALALWQLVVWSGIYSATVLPGPVPVFKELFENIGTGSVWEATSTTMRRAAVGYAIALLIGVVVGALVSRVEVLRRGVGSMLTGLQTMPSIAWFPLAILLFKGGEGAIMFVVVMGAAPAIANGLIAGTDTVPPLLIRAGRVLGARRFTLYRHVILPASLPGFVGGLKQGWAFAWRSLLAGELLVLTGQKALGVQLSNARELSDAAWLLSVMIVILVIGIVVDSLLFGTMERAIRRRWGLVDPAG